MLWLIATIASYFLFAVTGLIDRYLVRGPIQGPKVYAFYIGVSSIFALFLIPFGFSLPALSKIWLNFATGAVFVFSLFSLYCCLKKFEASRIIPAIGGILPLFTLGLTYVFFKQQIFWQPSEAFSFVLLLSGSLLITVEKNKLWTFQSFQAAGLAAFFLSLYFLLSKMVYLEQPFWSGFIWTRLGAFLTALFFLVSGEVRKEIFKKRIIFKIKTLKLLIFNQSLGTGGTILQNWAIALVPLGFLAFINALQGTQYIFLLFLVVLFSLKLPQLLKEDISKKILLRKITSILLIILGLLILYLRQ